MYERLTPGLMLPLYDLLGRRRLWSQTRLLRRLQWRSADELEARAAERLGRLLEQAGRTVPHYRRLFDQSGFDPSAVRATADLARLPITRKGDLRTCFPDRVVARGLPARRRQWAQTSGSTGQPLEFYADRRARDVWLATHFLFLEWLGTGLWHTAVRISGTQYILGNARPPLSRPSYAWACSARPGRCSAAWRRPTASGSCLTPGWWRRLAPTVRRPRSALSGPRLA